KARPLHSDDESGIADRRASSACHRAALLYRAPHAAERGVRGSECYELGGEKLALSWSAVPAAAAAPASQPFDSLPPESSAKAIDGCSSTPANPAESATTPASTFVRRNFCPIISPSCADEIG